MIEDEGHPVARPRPLVHLTPESGWVNDPLGLTWHDGRYHLFTQYVPDAVEWAPTCHWAHAVSDDLIRWSSRPVALAPGDGDGGVWSGSLTAPAPGARDETGVQIFYTSVDLQDVSVGRVRVACPSDGQWDTWVKGAVLAELPADIDAVAFRDPYVFHDGQSWRMVLGGGLADATAVAWSWVSTDRRHWDFDGELARRPSAEREPVWTGEVWECPVLFPLDGRWILVFSVWKPSVPQWVGYAVGELNNGRFVAEAWGRLGYGPSYYASSTFVDADGRRGLVHWLRGVVDPDSQWAGAASVPQVLQLDGDTLVAQPHPNATSGPLIAVIEPGEEIKVPSACWVQWDCQAPTTAGDEEPIALEVRDTDGGRVLRVERRVEQVIVTTLGPACALPLGSSQQIGLLIDHLVIEVFSNAGILALPVAPVSSLTMTARGGGQVVVRGIPRPNP